MVLTDLKERLCYVNFLTSLASFWVVKFHQRPHKNVSGYFKSRTEHNSFRIKQFLVLMTKNSFRSRRKIVIQQFSAETCPASLTMALAKENICYFLD